jgi:hypothetical protein
MMDFAVGSWVRFGGDAWLVQDKRESIHMLDLVRVGDGAWTTTTPEGLSPWTPRVGDWVSVHPDRACDELWRRPWKVTWWDGCYAYGHADGGWYPSSLIPAPPPTQAVEPSKAERDAFLAKLQGVSRAYEERIAIELLSRPLSTEALAAINPPTAPRSNTTCTRCGGPAYAGLLHVECLAAKCETPAELEPDDVIREVDGHLAKWPRVRPEFAGKRYEECREWHAAHVEPAYVAIGRGVVAKHPTEEGARAAWRLAVGGGR